MGYNFGIISRLLTNEDMEEDLTDNIDEIHFVVNLENGKTLGFASPEDVKYAEITSGGHGITILVRITGGKIASIRPPFLIFQIQERNYPIRNILDNVRDVSYRTQTKRLDGQGFFLEWIKETRAVRHDT